MTMVICYGMYWDFPMVRYAFETAGNMKQPLRPMAIWGCNGNLSEFPWEKFHGEFHGDF